MRKKRSKVYIFANSTTLRISRGFRDAKLSGKSSFFCEDFCKPLTKVSSLPEISLERFLLTGFSAPFRLTTGALVAA